MLVCTQNCHLNFNSTHCAWVRPGPWALKIYQLSHKTLLPSHFWHICIILAIDGVCSFVIFRPFTFALHSLIGVGFLAATFLVKPFLPGDEPNDNSQNSICYQNVTETIATSSHNALLGGVPKIAWPFIISGAWCIVFCSGFAILSMYLTWILKVEKI